MASIWWHGKLLCSGTVLAPTYVLTAAHCVKTANPTEFTVRVGFNDDRNAEPIGVTSGYAHPKWSLDTVVNDVGILHLAHAVPVGTPTARLATANDDALEKGGTAVTAAGWGKLFYKGPIPHKLREANLRVVADPDCGPSISEGYFASTICADGKMQGICNGDSGGPLLWRRGATTIQIGITSAGFACGHAPSAARSYSWQYFTEVNNVSTRAFITKIAGV